MGRASLRSVGRTTAWVLTHDTGVQGDVGHPQGLSRWGDDWLVTTVHTDRRVGEVLVVSGDGAVIDRIDVTDGDRFHPGGLHVDAVDATGCWIAVAEYRPRSTTRVIRLGRDLTVTTAFVFDDHLGALCPLSDGTLFAVSWASRRWYRLDTSGRILDQRTTSTRWVDLQDIGSVQGTQVVATGVGELATPSGPVQLGGLQVIDVDEMRVVHDAPVAACMPSGRAATYNGVHLDLATDDEVLLHCIVDDTTAVIATWKPLSSYPTS